MARVLRAHAALVQASAYGVIGPASARDSAFIVVVVALSVSVGCGGGGGSAGTGPVSTPGQATIGPQGGAVPPLQDGSSVTVPPGALAASTTITLQQSGMAPNGNPRYLFGPAGTSFSAPVTVRLPAPAGQPAPALYWSRPGNDAAFDVVPGRVAGGMLEASVRHFSVGFAGAACTEGSACGATLPCRAAAMACSSGVPACVDAGSAADDTPCGDGAVCTAGVCGPPRPPVDLRYEVNPAIYTIGVTIAANHPAHGGGRVVVYTVAPPLPAGLLLDPTAGTISGTPEAETATAVYVVTASGAGGSATADLTITVNAAAPANLRYAANPATYTVGVSIAPNVPASGGGPVAGYSVAPALPAGLSLDPGTGVISGTPAAITATGAYVVTAANSGGSARATLAITVNAPAPTDLAYLVNPASYTVGVPIAPNAPSSGGGTVVSYSVAPALPPGLSLDAVTGLIGGTPTAPAPTASYVVTASNTGGASTATLVITVRAQPPTALTYATNPAIYRVGIAIPPNAPSSGGGAVVSYSTSPPLPAGLVLSESTGVVTGTPTVVASTAGYVITATNSGGSTVATLTITVLPQPPSDLAYARNPATYTRGIAVPRNAPTHRGGAVDLYETTPALPAGLRLDPATGIIDGTPTVAAAAADHVVTASNAGGSTTATVRVTVKPATVVAGGYGHTCAVASGAAWCWGSNYDGQLGTTEATTCTSNVLGLPCSVEPVAVSGLTSGVQAIAAGGASYGGHSCAIVNGGAWCWGNNTDGQIGDGTTTFRSVPVPVTGLGTGVEAIAIGWSHSCAIKDGGLWCWGDHVFGELGIGSASTSICQPGTRFQVPCSMVPVPVLGMASGVEAVAVGAWNSCAIQRGALWCWGDDTYGQVGDGPGAPESCVGSPCTRSPVRVSGLAADVTQVSASPQHTCALVNGGATCWGNNVSGQLGNDTHVDSAAPVPVSGLASGVQAIAAGSYHTCAVANGGALCWGDDSYGEIGNGSSPLPTWPGCGLACSPVPVAVSGLSTGVEAIAAGDYHNCAVVAGALWCWGFGDYGQLGDGAAVIRDTPVTVKGLSGVAP